MDPVNQSTFFQNVGTLGNGISQIPKQLTQVGKLMVCSLRDNSVITRMTQMIFAPGQDHLNQLPYELRLKILGELEPEDLLSMRRVSTDWSKIMKDKYFQTELSKLSLNPFQWIFFTQKFSWSDEGVESSLVIGGTKAPKKFFSKNPSGYEKKFIQLRYISRSSQGIERKETITFTANRVDGQAFKIKDTGWYHRKKDFLKSHFFFSPDKVFPIEDKMWKYGDFTDQPSQYLMKLLSGKPCGQLHGINKTLSVPMITMTDGSSQPRIERHFFPHEKT
ncbi:MAG: hypothetical protein K940chlam3_01283 [Chlamydiae bacterium]|nr:hypothetical protein [Chlamydiota bacterium]